MRKYQKAAVVVAMLGSVGTLGAGTAVADDKPDVSFNVSHGGCKTESGDNIAVLSNIGVANGLAGGGILSFGDNERNGSQEIPQSGNTVDCSLKAFTG